MNRHYDPDYDDEYIYYPRFYTEWHEETVAVSSVQEAFEIIQRLVDSGAIKTNHPIPKPPSMIAKTSEDADRIIDEWEKRK